MAFIPDKPPHGRFAFRSLNSTQYKTYAQQYSKAKAGGIRCVYGWSIGASNRFNLFGNHTDFLDI